MYTVSNRRPRKNCLSSSQMEEQKYLVTDQCSQTVEYVAEKYPGVDRNYQYVILQQPVDQQSSQYEETVSHQNYESEIKAPVLPANSKVKGQTLYSCHMCQKLFQTAGQLKRHFLSHDPPKMTNPVSTDLKSTNQPSTKSQNAGLTSHRLTESQKWQRWKLYGKKYPCPQCEKVFCTPSALQRHSVVHTGAKPYSCDICGSLFSQRSNLQDHHKRHMGTSNFNCSVCNQQFQRNYKLQLHIREVHEGKKPECKICGRQVFSWKMSEHMKRHTEPQIMKENTHMESDKRHIRKQINKEHQIHKCLQCGKIFAESYFLKKHELTHLQGEEREVYHCWYCGRGYPHTTNLKRHQKWHTRNPTRCFICKMDFHSAENLTIHIQSHDEKRYYCGLCGRYFVSIETLINHRRKCLAAQRGDYNCAVCGGRYESQALLVQHAQEFHTEDNSGSCNNTANERLCRAFRQAQKCGICPKVFSTKACLNKHFLTHAVKFAELSYSCKFCRQTIYSTNQEKINNHIETCEKSRIKCQFCDKTFGNKLNLDYHNKRIHPKMTENENKNEIFGQPPDDHVVPPVPNISIDKVYCCGICLKEFSRPAFMKVHIKKHSLNEVHTCNYCNTWFGDPTALSQHICRNNHTDP